ncbi:MAG: hypothetical protein V1836_02860 [Candidatus Aenigmatarchaeota archaeon]
MPLPGFNESTIALLLIFAFFIIATYAVIRVLLKVAVIALISMAFPVVLNYFGFYNNLNFDSILIFGILGSVFYIIYMFVKKAVDMIWAAAGLLHQEKKEKQRKQHRKPKKNSDEVEIPEQ